MRQVAREFLVIEFGEGIFGVVRREDRLGFHDTHVAGWHDLWHLTDVALHVQQVRDVAVRVPDGEHAPFNGQASAVRVIRDNLFEVTLIGLEGFEGVLEHALVGQWVVGKRGQGGGVQTAQMLEGLVDEQDLWTCPVKVGAGQHDRVRQCLERLGERQVLVAFGHAGQQDCQTGRSDDPLVGTQKMLERRDGQHHAVIAGLQGLGEGLAVQASAGDVGNLRVTGVEVKHALAQQLVRGRADQLEALAFRERNDTLEIEGKADRGQFLGQLVEFLADH